MNSELRGYEGMRIMNYEDTNYELRIMNYEFGIELRIMNYEL